MNPVTHFLAGWLVANAGRLERRDRALVAVSGVIPDIDGLGIISAVTNWDSGHGLALYGEYHHVLAHNIFFGVTVAAAAYAISKNKRVTAFLSLLSFHLHLLGDLLSGRGPDGTAWTISYFFPLSDMQLSWAGQWELNAWPNFAITTVALLLTLWLVWKRGFSPVGIFSLRADRAVVEALRSRIAKQEQN